MQKFLQIFICLIVTPIILYSQKDSVPTLILQRINESGKPVQRIIKPNKKIEILTSHDKNYKFKKIILIGDSSILINSDTILLNDIIRIRAKYRGNNTIKIICLSAGFVFLQVALWGRLAQPYGGSDDMNAWDEYERNIKKYIYIATIGGVLFTSGIITPRKISFSTKNKWIIKPYYYK